MTAVGRRYIIAIQRRKGKVALRQHARRQIFDDLARCAVVVDRVRWTARNVGQVNALGADLVHTVVPVRMLGFEP